MKTRRVSVYFSYYKLITAPSLIITLLCGWTYFISGQDSLITMVILKLNTNGLLYLYLRYFNKHHAYYANLGVKAGTIYTLHLLADFAILLLLITCINLAR